MRNLFITIAVIAVIATVWGKIQDNRRIESNYEGCISLANAKADIAFKYQNSYSIQYVKAVSDRQVSDLSQCSTARNY